MTAPTPPVSARSLARGARAPRALVVDDEADLRELLELTLVGMGLDVDCAADLGAARRLLVAHRYALCLTDMRLPDGNGLSLVEEIGAAHPDTPVAVITAYGSAESAVAALKAGAFDYLSKPVGLDALRALVRSALGVSVGEGGAGPMRPASAVTGPARNPGLAAQAVAPTAPNAAADRTATPQDRAEGDGAGGERGGRTEAGLLGVSPAIEAVRTRIAQLARSMAPVAITGESGSGKELAARLIHTQGSRARRPFVAVNCGAIPDALMEAEFFGYRRGAFTGADQDRIGFFQAADGGTLFLDEVADLPLSMQVKLLRAIQERRVRRIGSALEEPVDVRIVSATHQNLADCVAAGRFRQDLFYRLNVIELRMPALRERLEDVPLIAASILERLAARAGLQAAPRLSSMSVRYLQSYGFPGNVRELENLLERALAFAGVEVINVEDLGLRPATADVSGDERAASHDGDGAAAPDAADGGAEGVHPRTRDPAQLDANGVPESLPDYLDALERRAILCALEQTGHNRTAAARSLGITFRALRHRMQRLGLS